MPSVCVVSFLAARGPSDADDRIMWMSFAATPITCGVAAFRVANSTTPARKWWTILNAFTALGALVAGIVLFIIVLQMVKAWN